MTYNAVFTAFRRSLFLGIASSALLGGCELGVDGSGIVESQSYTLEEFSQIQVADGFELRLIMSDEYRVVVHADDNVIDEVRVAQKDDAIRIELGDLNVSSATLEVDVLVPEVSKIKLTDGSRLDVRNVRAAGSLELEAADGSELRLGTEPAMLAYLHLTCEDGSRCRVLAQAEESIVEVRDGSHGRLHGFGTSMTLLLSDGSTVDASDFEVKTLSLRADDASSGEVFVTREVRGKLSDASHLDILGDPKIELTTENASSFARK